MGNKYKVSFNGIELDLEQIDKEIKIDEHSFNPEVIYNGDYYRVFVGSKELRVEFRDDTVFLDGKEVDFEFRHSPTIISKKNLRSKKGADIRAAIPGKIVEVLVKQGEEVSDQQCLLVLESMKMRNEILSPINGYVDRIDVGEGSQVVTKQLLLKLKPKKEK